MFNRNTMRQISVGAVLGLFYYLLKLLIRPEPYTGLTHELGRFLSSIAVGIIIFMLIALVQSIGKKPPAA